MTVEPEVRARQKFFEQAREITPYVAAEFRGTVFVVPTNADERFFVKQHRKELRLLGQAVATVREHRPRSGSTFVDVGAHIGTTTVSALAHHGFERAVAIEPDPANLRLLRANVSLNGLDDRARVVGAAVSAEPGTASFTRRDPESGPAYWTKGRITEEAAPDALEVEVVTLDGIGIDVGDVGLLWLDCQKHEAEALRGARQFIDQRVPIVFALRQKELTGESPYLELLAGYERFVDLRAGDRDNWQPEFEDMSTLFERRSAAKALTDVLVF